MDEIDRRSEQLRVSRDELADVARRWPVADATPEDVKAMLLEARQLFVGGAVTYSNFASAALKSLQSAELTLKHRLGQKMVERRITMGALLRHEWEKQQVLDAGGRERFNELALRFRNGLSHPKQTVAYTPGMAAIVLRTAHEQIAAIFAAQTSETSR